MRISPLNRIALAFAATLCAFAVFAMVAHAATKIMWDGHQFRVFQSTGALGQRWDPSMVSVSGGTLTERISGNTSGGVGGMDERLYGRYDADFRISRGAGKFVILLSGREGCPYNELDIAESSVGDSGRTRITATRHWGVGKANLMQARVAGDFTVWHHITVKWTALHMNVLLDGVRFAHYTTHVSHTPMHLNVQTAGANVGGAGADATLQVRNLVVA